MNTEPQTIQKVIVQPLCGVNLEVKYSKDKQGIQRTLKYYGYGATPDEAKENLHKMKELAEEEFIRSL